MEKFRKGNNHINHINNHKTKIFKNLKLIYEEVKEQNPDDCSYAYSGYTPLTFLLTIFIYI